MERSKITTDYYNQFSGDFAKIPFKETLLPFFSKHTSNPPICRVLDVGSGPGALAKWISDQGHEVTCLDPSIEMVKSCKEKGLHAVQGTLEDTKFDQEFQIVLAISSLIHVSKSDIENHMQIISKLLDSEGIFFISMLLGEGEKMEDPLKKGSDRYFNYFQETELEAIFRRAGLATVEKIAVESKKMNKKFALYALKKDA